VGELQVKLEKKEQFESVGRKEFKIGWLGRKEKVKAVYSGAGRGPSKKTYMKKGNERTSGKRKHY